MREFNGREIDKAFCSCGGEFHEVETTKEEEKKRGCSCCVAAIQCDKCKTRILFDLCAPEWNTD